MSTEHNCRRRRPFAYAGFVAILVIALGATNLPAQDLTWQELPDMPAGKWEAATTVVDGRFYLFGGYEGRVRSSKRVDVFDPADGSWTRIQDMPSAVTHLNAVLDGRSVWFAGGFKDGYKGHAITEVWSYDLDLDRYTAAPLLPGPRAGGGLALVGRKLHYIGGLKADRDTDAADHWVLDLDDWAAGSASWQEAAPMPDPRNRFSAVAIGNRIYAIGGQYHHDSMQLDQARVDIYDAATDSWSRGPDLPKGTPTARPARSSTTAGSSWSAATPPRPAARSRSTPTSWCWRRAASGNC